MPSIIKLFKRQAISVSLSKTMLFLMPSPSQNCYTYNLIVHDGLFGGTNCQTSSQSRGFVKTEKFFML